MKNLATFEQAIGGDGGKLNGALGVDQTDLVAKVEARYPLAKVVEPATKALDSALDKLEQIIPGNWDKPMIEKIKAEYKDELLKLLAE